MRKDDGAFAEDRRRAQHHGDDHQLDVADPPLSSGAQYYQADGGAGRVPRPEYRSKVPRNSLRLFGFYMSASVSLMRDQREKKTRKRAKACIMQRSNSVMRF